MILFCSDIASSQGGTDSSRRMLFNSLTLAVFFAGVLLLHRLPLGWTTKKFNLLLASYPFYAAWNPPFVLLLWLSTVTDWFAAFPFAQTRRSASSDWPGRFVRSIA